MFAFLGSLFTGGLSALLSPILSFFTSKEMFSMEEFKSLTTEQAGLYASYTQAAVAADLAKVQMNATTGAHVMVYAFGLPAALHWNAVFLDSTFKFGWGVPALPGAYAGAEVDIALSFFITAIAPPVMQSISNILGKR